MSDAFNNAAAEVKRLKSKPSDDEMLKVSFWALHQRWMDIWNHPRPSGRMSVCPYVTRYLGDRTLLFMKLGS